MLPRISSTSIDKCVGLGIRSGAQEAHGFVTYPEKITIRTPKVSSRNQTPELPRVQEAPARCSPEEDDDEDWPRRSPRLSHPARDWEIEMGEECTLAALRLTSTSGAQDLQNGSDRK